jgi:hypothetical protein
VWPEAARERGDFLEVRAELVADGATGARTMPR